MHIFKTVLAVAGAMAFSCIASTAHAQEDEHTMSMISLMTIEPSKEEQFSEAWSTIRETAMENGYSYTDYVGGWRNERWIVTPLKNFADVDALFAARDAVSEAGGRKFERALASFRESLTNSHTFFTKDDRQLSYWPETYEPGPYMEIDTFHYRYGKSDEMRAILADYKALVESKNSPYGYQVSWDWIGSEGNSVTFISYAADAVAMAQMNASINEMMDGDETYENILERFLAISTGSQTMIGIFNPEASINLPEQE